MVRERRRGPGVNAIEERVSEGRVLNDEARLEKLRRHDAQVEEESKAREARRVDKSRRRRDEFSVSLKCFKLGIECDSFEGVYFQYYNHKRYPVQPTKDEMEQTACVEFPPWKKRGSDFIWDPEN